MRADATHRFEFQVDGGRRPPFVCLARTRSEAEQIARHAGAPVRFRRRLAIGSDDGDDTARLELRKHGFLRAPWRDDVLELVSVLDHVRFSGGAMSVVPVAFLPAAEILARGLRACECGKHGSERIPTGLRAVEPGAAMTARMVEDGGWELHLWQGAGRPRVRHLPDWGRCSTDPGALALGFRPATPVWVVAHRVLVTLLAVADLRPGELSAVRVDARA
ncbi:hypothetical protein [Agrococcus citreus]|uniref:Uncharacterized protein n=1 Tax=Agrococcus citreus TaxID=84643 RepID=A0ABN1YU52_9MICO